jgi:predicted nucleic acid-binding protein
MPNELFLVDTSVWIFALRKDPVLQIRDRIDFLLKEDTVITTGIIKLELLAGTKTEKEYNRLKSRFDALESIETDEALWRNACKHGFKLRRRGLTIPATDILIASCALQTGAILLHADMHFDLMEKPLSLRAESYVLALKKALL